MAVRTTQPAVVEILIDNYDSDNRPVLKPFIAAASRIIDRVDTCATAKGITMTTGELTDLETWLAAALYCVTDPIYTSKSTKSASGSFQTGPPVAGWGGNEYGRLAMAMDYSGCLQNFALKQRASAVWLGKAPSDQIPYDERS